MGYWHSLSNKCPTTSGNYYVADISCNLFKCKWDGNSFNNNKIIAWLEPDNNQTADEAYQEFNNEIVNNMLNNPFKAFEVSQ